MLIGCRIVSSVTIIWHVEVKETWIGHYVIYSIFNRISDFPVYTNHLDHTLVSNFQIILSTCFIQVLSHKIK